MGRARPGPLDLLKASGDAVLLRKPFTPETLAAPVRALVAESEA